jgi:hypothetical protein
MSKNKAMNALANVKEGLAARSKGPAATAFMRKEKTPEDKKAARVALSCSKSRNKPCFISMVKCQQHYTVVDPGAKSRGQQVVGSTISYL